MILKLLLNTRMIWMIFIKHWRTQQSNNYFWWYISLVFITQFYFAVPKNFRLNSTYYFVKKTPNNWELQQISFNHLSDIDFKDFLQKCTAKPHSFSVIDATLASDNPLRFRKNLLKRI